MSKYETPEKIWHVRRPYDATKRVSVYKNLHNGLWSVRQAGIVVIHASNIFLRDVVYRVQEGGRLRVVREKRKNVHAFVEGYLINSKELRAGTIHMADEELHHTPAYYNPYTCTTFECKDTGIPITTSDFVDMDVTDEQCPVLAIWATVELIEA